MLDAASASRIGKKRNFSIQTIFVTSKRYVQNDGAHYHRFVADADDFGNRIIDRLIAQTLNKTQEKMKLSCVTTTHSNSNYLLLQANSQVL